RREPRIEDVWVALENRLLAVVLPRRLAGLVLGQRDEDFTVGPVPRRYLVPPPELPRYAPRLYVPEPFEVRILPEFGDESDPALFDGRDGRLGELLGVHVPLLRKPGLDNYSRPVA